MDIIWYLNRLKCMDLREVSFRFSSKLTTGLERIFDIEDKYKYHFKKYEFISKALNELVDDSTDKKEVIELADQYISGEYTVFDLKFNDSSLRWRKDYFTGIESECDYWSKINYRDKSQVGNVKYIWEINRLQFLPVIALAYRITNEKKYYLKLKEYVETWNEQNPYNRGINWASSLECALRNISLLITYYLIEGELDSKTDTLFKKIIFFNGLHISKHFSLYSSANNHLIGELLGLFITGLHFQDKYGGKWVKKSYHMMKEQLFEQNYSDGVNKEQALYYHIYVVDYFLMFILVCEKVDLKLNDEYYSLLEKMINYLDIIINNNNIIPNIGDMDSGFSFVIDSSLKFNYYKSVITSGSILFNKRFVNELDTIDNRNKLFFGKNAIEKYKENYETSKMIKYEDDKIFKYGGYAILLDKSSQLIFDFGEIGYKSIAAHGHSDCLSFLLSKNGVPFFVDCGTYSYDSDSNKRYYFKSSKAHNVLSVNDKDQAEYGGSFIWLKKPKAKLLDYHFSKEFSYIKAAHDGYNSYIEDYNRTIYFKKNKYVLILDKVMNIKENKINIYYNLNADCKYIYENEFITIINRNEKINIYSSEKQLNFRQGETCPYIGWESYNIDESHPCNNILVSKLIKSNYMFGLLINLDDKKRKFTICKKVVNIHDGEKGEKIEIR